jgi:hypothetical protein
MSTLKQQLVEQRLAFGEPAVDRSEKLARLIPLAPDRARAAPCSLQRVVPRIWLVVFVP